MKVLSRALGHDAGFNARMQRARMLAILEDNPAMTWPEFQDEWGQVLPDLTAKQFWWARSRARGRAGNLRESC
jgi:hypothetical protein